MRLSTRNQLSGTITEVTVGTVMATVKVRLDGGDQIVTASITKDAVEDLGLETGRPATVLIKSTEVMIGVDDEL
jgi:molybdopterin-binding protein